MAHPVVSYKSCQQDSMKRAMRMEKSRSWPSAHDWKSCIPQKGIEGSNPSFSANKIPGFAFKTGRTRNFFFIYADSQKNIPEKRGTMSGKSIFIQAIGL